MLGNCDGCDKYAKLKDGLCADCRDAAEIRDLRDRVARLEGALGGLYVRCRAEGWLRRRDVVAEMDTARAVLQDAMQGVVTIAALAPDAARKEGV